MTIFPYNIEKKTHAGLEGGGADEPRAIVDAANTEAINVPFMIRYLQRSTKNVDIEQRKRNPTKFAGSQLSCSYDPRSRLFLSVIFTFNGVVGFWWGPCMYRNSTTYAILIFSYLIFVLVPDLFLNSSPTAFIVLSQ